MRRHNLPSFLNLTTDDVSSLPPFASSLTFALQQRRSFCPRPLSLFHERVLRKESQVFFLWGFKFSFIRCLPFRPTRRFRLGSQAPLSDTRPGIMDVTPLFCCPIHIPGRYSLRAIVVPPVFFQSVYCSVVSSERGPRPFMTDPTFLWCTLWSFFCTGPHSRGLYKVSSLGR